MLSITRERLLANASNVIQYHSRAGVIFEKLANEYANAANVFGSIARERSWVFERSRVINPSRALASVREWLQFMFIVEFNII